MGGVRLAGQVLYEIHIGLSLRKEPGEPPATVGARRCRITVAMMPIADFVGIGGATTAWIFRSTRFNGARMTLRALSQSLTRRLGVISTWLNHSDRRNFCDLFDVIHRAPRTWGESLNRLPNSKGVREFSSPIDATGSANLSPLASMPPRIHDASRNPPREMPGRPRRPANAIVLMRKRAQ